MNIALGLLGGWIAPSDSINVYNSTAIEFPPTPARIVTHVTLTINLIANGITSGSPLINMTKNGLGIGGGSAVNFSSTTTPGVYTTGPIATGSTSSSDTYGLEQTNSATGTITFSAILALN